MEQKPPRVSDRGPPALGSRLDFKRDRPPLSTVIWIAKPLNLDNSLTTNDIQVSFGHTALFPTYQVHRYCILTFTYLNMAEQTTEPKVETSSEPKLENTEIELAIYRVQGEGAKDESAKDAVCLHI